MYGNSVGPPSHSAATVITLRVLFAVAGFLTCGLLACVPLFRVAVLRGRWFDWALAWVSMPVSVAGLAVVGSLPESDPRTDLAMGVLLLTGLGATVYFLVVDVRAYAAPRPSPGHVPPPVQPVPPVQPARPYYGQRPTGFGAQQTGPYAPTPVPRPPTPMPQAPFAPPPAAPPRTPAPPPHRPAPARIDQVRAELDELSDYLRKHDGNGNRDHRGNHEGGG